MKRNTENDDIVEMLEQYKCIMSPSDYMAMKLYAKRGTNNGISYEESVKKQIRLWLETRMG